MNLETILPILIAFFVVTVSPGPANIAVASVAMDTGRKTGLQFALGLSVGLAFWGLFAATGLGVLLQASELALLTLKLLGGLYLLWLAYQTAKSAAKPVSPNQRFGKGGNWFLRGLVLNLSNPKAVVAWMAALSTGMAVGDNTHQLIVATLICMLIGVLNYSIHALAFSFSGMRKTYQRFRRWFESTIAGLFTLAGFSLLKSAFSR